MTAPKPEHSPLGASASGRWRNCYGSVNLIKRHAASLPKDESPDVKLGTEAHSLADYCLKNRDDASSFVGMDFDGEFSAPITEEMANAVNEYLAEVRKYSELPSAELYVEEHISADEIDEWLYGRGDAAVWLPLSETLYAFDYKHGVGVSVPIEDNTQMEQYGLSWWLKFRHLGPKKIVLTIVQPRAPGKTVKTRELTPMDIFDIGLDIKKDVEATRDPNAPLNPGSWCANSFCPVRHCCPALIERSRAAAANEKGELKDPATFTLEELGKALHEAEFLHTWYNAVWKYADALAAKGRLPVDWKLVQGNGKRVWNPDVDEDDIAKAVQRKSNAIDPYQPRELFTAPMMEKLMGKAKFAKFVEDFKTESKKALIVSKPGGVSLAPVSDKRPAYTGDNGDGFEPVKMEGW